MTGSAQELCNQDTVPGQATAFDDFHWVNSWKREWQHSYRPASAIEWDEVSRMFRRISAHYARQRAKRRLANTKLGRKVAFNSVGVHT